MRSRQWQPAQIRARLAGKVTATRMVATPFRAGDAIRLLVRVRIMDMPGSAADLNANLVRLVDGTSDSVVTDSSGRVLAANPPFFAAGANDHRGGRQGRSGQREHTIASGARGSVAARLASGGAGRRPRIAPAPADPAIGSGAAFAAMDVADGGAGPSVAALLEEIDLSTQRAAGLYANLRGLGAT